MPLLSRHDWSHAVHQLAIHVDRALGHTRPLPGSFYFTRRIKKTSRAVRKKESELLSIVEEVLTSIRVVKAFAREDYEEHRFASQSRTTSRPRCRPGASKPNFRQSLKSSWPWEPAWCFGMAHGSLSGQLSAGVLIVFLLYLGKMYKPMRDLSKMTDTVSKAAVGFERIREVLETESRDADLPRARKAPTLQRQN